MWITTEVRPRSVGDAAKASRFPQTTSIRRLRSLSGIGRAAILRLASTRWSMPDWSCSSELVISFVLFDVEWARGLIATGKLEEVWLGSSVWCKSGPSNTTEWTFVDFFQLLAVGVVAHRFGNWPGSCRRLSGGCAYVWNCDRQTSAVSVIWHWGPYGVEDTEGILQFRVGVVSCYSWGTKASRNGARARLRPPALWGEDWARRRTRAKWDSSRGRQVVPNSPWSRGPRYCLRSPSRHQGFELEVWKGVDCKRTHRLDYVLSRNLQVSKRAESERLRIWKTIAFSKSLWWTLGSLRAGRGWWPTRWTRSGALVLK